MSTFRCGETGTRTQATVTRRQISNLLRYHSGTSPFMYMNLLFLFCGCKGITIFHFLQVFRKLFLIFFIKHLVNSYLSNTQYLHIFILEKYITYFSIHFFFKKCTSSFIYTKCNNQQNIKKLQAIVLLGVFRYLFKFVSTN